MPIVLGLVLFCASHFFFSFIHLFSFALQISLIINLVPRACIADLGFKAPDHSTSRIPPFPSKPRVAALSKKKKKKKKTPCASFPTTDGKSHHRIILLSRLLIHWPLVRYYSLPKVLGTFAARTCLHLPDCVSRVSTSRHICAESCPELPRLGLAADLLS